MKGIYSVDNSGFIPLASVADFAAGSYPIFGGYNFEAGADSYPMLSILKPNAGEAMLDFQARLQTWLQTFFDTTFGIGNLTGLSVTLSNDGVNIILAINKVQLTVDDNTKTLPMFSVLGSSMTLVYDQAVAALQREVKFSIRGIQDGLPSPNYNASVNNYPGSGYNSRV